MKDMVMELPKYFINFHLSNIKYKLYSFESDLKTSKHGTNPLFACFHASYLPILMEIRTQVLILNIA